MSNSIEQIWKQGFINESSTAIPAINNLYNRKAQNIVDRVHRMYTINVKYVYGLSLFTLLGSIAFGWYALAIVFPALLLWIATISNRLLKNMDIDNKADNSYHYIKSFNLSFHEMVETFTGVYQVFYPVLVATILFEFSISTPGGYATEAALQRFPESALLFGIPWWFYVVAVIVIGITGLFSARLYKLDLDIVYGRVMKKMDSILADMEELRQ